MTLTTTANPLQRWPCPHASEPPTDSPFNPANENAYRRWRARKLARCAVTSDELIVELRDPARLSQAELTAMRQRCRDANMAFYSTREPQAVDKQAIRALASQLGLEQLDGNLCADADRVSTLRVRADATGGGYIPYTNRALNWHTDGYYNLPEQRIRAFLMHCITSAAQGGENAYVDHELVYIRLRDAGPHYIRALMRPDAMTIPANIDAQGRETRPSRTGPVFVIDPINGHLQMRYTARGRNVIWREDADTQAAIGYLREILDTPLAPVLTHRLHAGQGVVCNNIIHSRSAFTDDPARPRVLYRARYHDRIAGSDLPVAGD